MRSDDALLVTFPRPLARLILCGGGELPAAWGPLHRSIGAASTGRQHAWHPEIRLAFGPDGRDFTPLQCPDGWSLPLEHWRSRLAVIAAWMLGYRDERWAWVDLRGLDDPGRVALSIEGTLIAMWEASDGRGGEARNLPTLPTHLRDQDLAVALLLALYDVPEMRARVEALYA